MCTGRAASAGQSAPTSSHPPTMKSGGAADATTSNPVPPTTARLASERRPPLHAAGPPHFPFRGPQGQPGPWLVPCPPRAGAVAPEGPLRSPQPRTPLPPWDSLLERSGRSPRSDRGVPGVGGQGGRGRRGERHRVRAWARACARARRGGCGTLPGSHSGSFWGARGASRVADRVPLSAPRRSRGSANRDRGARGGDELPVGLSKTRPQSPSSSSVTSIPDCRAIASIWRTMARRSAGERRSRIRTRRHSRRLVGGSGA